MKRLFAAALVLGAVSGFGLVGCSDTAKEEVKTTTQDSGGKTTETTTHEVSKSSETAPAPGEPGTGGTTSTTTK